MRHVGFSREKEDIDSCHRCEQSRKLFSSFFCCLPSQCVPSGALFCLLRFSPFARAKHVKWLLCMYCHRWLKAICGGGVVGHGLLVSSYPCLFEEHDPSSSTTNSIASSCFFLFGFSCLVHGFLGSLRPVGTRAFARVLQAESSTNVDSLHSPP